MAYFKNIIRKDFVVVVVLILVIIAGALYFSSGKTAKAERYYLLGKAYETQGYYQNAIDAYKKSTEARQSSVAYNAMGNLYGLLGDNIQAINSFQKGIEADKNDVENYFDISRVYVMLGQYDKAEQILLSIIDKGGGTASIYALLGTVYIETKKWDKAEASFRKSLDMQQRASTYNDLGFVYESAGKTPLAIENYQKALQLDSNYEIARNNLQRLANV